jgi:hypothetical protein
MLNNTLYTKEQKRGMIILRDWLWEIHFHSPNRKIISKGHINASAGILSEWVTTRLTESTYSKDTKGILNLLRELYKLNKGKTALNIDSFIWEIPKPPFPLNYV